jgi:hypothetical protein
LQCIGNRLRIHFSSVARIGQPFSGLYAPNDSPGIRLKYRKPPGIDPVTLSGTRIAYSTAIFFQDAPELLIVTMLLVSYMQ